MSEPDHPNTMALAVLSRALVESGPPGVGLAELAELEAYGEPRLRELIMRVRADPTEAGAARALAWFYGSGLPDKTKPPPATAVLDLDEAVRAALQACVDQDGADVVRARFAEAYRGSR